MSKSSFEVKVGLAEMLKGGVIMDVMNPEQARIAEDAGAVAVMALERIPALIREEGGISRMSRLRDCMTIRALKTLRWPMRPSPVSLITAATRGG